MRSDFIPSKQTISDDLTRPGPSRSIAFDPVENVSRLEEDHHSFAQVSTLAEFVCWSDPKDEHGDPAKRELPVRVRRVNWVSSGPGPRIVVMKELKQFPKLCFVIL